MAEPSLEELKELSEAIVLQEQSPVKVIYAPEYSGFSLQMLMLDPKAVSVGYGDKNVVLWIGRHYDRRVGYELLEFDFHAGVFYGRKIGDWTDGKPTGG